jgi:16S rRNA (guanine(966)-N(2))-methyltransferase RsmD
MPLRIISGKLRARKFDAPAGFGTRPTGDRARVALFNMLQDEVKGARVLDGFAGSGALSFEAVSRGAAMAVLFETDAAAIGKLRENAAKLGIEGNVEIRPSDFITGAPGLAGRCAFELVFLDPPYASGLLERALAVSESLLAPGGTIVTEHGSSAEMPDGTGSLKKTRSRRYGAAMFTFYKRRDGT